MSKNDIVIWKVAQSLFLIGEIPIYLIVTSYLMLFKKLSATVLSRQMPLALMLCVFLLKEKRQVILLEGY